MSYWGDVVRFSCLDLAEEILKNQLRAPVEVFFAWVMIGSTLPCSLELLLFFFVGLNCYQEIKKNISSLVTSVPSGDCLEQSVFI